MLDVDLAVKILKIRVRLDVLFVNGLPGALFDFSRVEEQALAFDKNTVFLRINCLVNIALFEQKGHPEVHYCYVGKFDQTPFFRSWKLKIQFLLLTILKEVGQLVNEEICIGHLIL